jgi:cytochrome c oxidase assembly factor CtaG
VIEMWRGVVTDGWTLADPSAPWAGSRVLTVWQFAPIVTAGLGLAAAWYLVGVWRVHRRHPARPWPLGRSLAFFAGLLAVVVATQSSIGAYDDELFSVHMVQHLLLIMVAPALFVLGRPVTLTLHAWGNPLHRWVLRVLRSRVVTALTWPPVAVVLYTATVAATHLTPFMNLVIENDTIHNCEHALYLVVGYLYFLPLVGSEPIRFRPSAPARFVLLAFTMPFDTAVGVFLSIVPHELFPAYLHDGRSWGPSPLADLHTGGSVMWIGGTIIMTIVMLVLAAHFVANPRRAGRLGGWTERRRVAWLRRGYLAAGLVAPGTLNARDIDTDGDEQVAAYNGYLAGLNRSRLPAPGTPVAPSGEPR